ncbi:DNA cytosine methyltransferase [Microvirga sp. GCM10011540]|uniref:DNA cytosine methyltransferase n=1 Tax=Microvirga sp. GCM10011540 TaxID=3317338 RepID=UPI0036087104
MRVVEVCCGAGGMSLGLSRAGFRVDRAIDVWPAALRVYRDNIPKTSLLSHQHHARQGDLSDLIALVPHVLGLRCDLIAGSPPCQDFSSAGSRIEGTRADLTLGYAIFVAAVRPRWILMENVPNARASIAWRQARTVLKRAGYGLTEQIVDASEYGVGQARQRFIVVGRLGEADGFLDEAIEAAKSKRPTTVRDMLGDDVGVHPGGDYPPDTRVFFVRPFKNGRGVRSIDEPCPSIIRTTGEKASRNYRPHPHDIAPHDKVPPLTSEQLSRLQGFPKDWSWRAIKTVRERDQMIANAVPAPLAEAIGRLIVARDKGESIPAVEPAYVKWLSSTKDLSGPVLRNRKAHLNRARKLLKGRILADLEAEIALLESAKEFTVLAPSVKSDLRLALRLHAEWRTISRKMSNPEVHEVDRDDEHQPTDIGPPTIRLQIKKSNTPAL